MPIDVAPLLASLLLAGLLAGCEAAPPPLTPEVDASATPARALDEPVGSDEQLSLDDRLTCQEAELFEQPPWVQAAWLAHGSVLWCEVDPGNASEPPRPAAICTGSGGLRLFGLPVMAVRVMAAGESAQGLQIDLQAGVAELAAAAGDALGVPLLVRQSDTQLDNGQSYQGVDDDGRVYYVSGRAGSSQNGRDADPADPDRPAGALPGELATFGCLAPGPVDAAGDTTTDPDAATAANLRRLVQTSPSLSQPSPLPRL